jgi:hypothetical protein
LLVAVFTAGQAHDGDDAAAPGRGPHAGLELVEQTAALEGIEKGSGLSASHRVIALPGISRAQPLAMITS